MLKSSVSKIKQFHNFSKGMYGITHKDVCDTIMGVKTATYEKNMGTLADAYIMDTLSGTNEYGKLSIELGKKLTTDSERVLEDWTINFQAENPICTTQSMHSKVYTTLFGDITVSMRCDILLPYKVVDIKCSKYGIDPYAYADDFQGMVYTNAFDVGSMVYEHFVFSAKTDEIKYDGNMEQPHASDEEVCKIINRYLSFVRSNGLEKYITWKD